MILPSIAEKAISEAVSAYIHFKMKRPDWAPLVTSEDEIAQSLRADSENHVVLDPLFYIMRKLDPSMSSRLFKRAARELAEDKPEWFPKLKRAETTQIKER